MVLIEVIFIDEKSNVRKSSAGKIQGEIKLSLEYRKDALLVMVHHAKDLAMPDGSKEAPNSYVKVFFLLKLRFSDVIYVIEFTRREIRLIL